MGRISWYLDEDVIQKSLIEALIVAKLDIVTTADVKMLGCSDYEQLIWAKENSRVIYTFNVGDFCRLHKEFIQNNKHHKGIVLGQQQRYSTKQQLQGILKITSQLSAEEIENQIIFISNYIL
jgi:hypothetical protein